MAFSIRAENTQRVREELQRIALNELRNAKFVADLNAGQ